MMNLNYVFLKEIEVFGFREKQYDAVALQLSESNKELDCELAKHYNALAYEYQHLISLYQFLSEGNECTPSTAKKIAEIYKSISNNYHSLANLLNSNNLTDSDDFWIKNLKDSYLFFSISFSKESEKLTILQ